MIRRLVILTEIISPYRIPLFNALARQEGIELHVIFLAETDPGLRQWEVYKDEIKFSYRVLPSWRKRLGRHNVLLNRGVSSALTDALPDAILCGGYNYLASWQALLWAKSRGVPFLLWSESNLQDHRGGYALVEFLKDEFLTRCNGFVVPGRSARAYLRSRRVSQSRIFTAPNAVDNDLFAATVATTRKNASSRRRELDLPDRYFLFVGRLVRAKGVFDLLAAYAKLDENLRREIGLVFVGDGTARPELELQAAAISSGMIRFAGFTQRDPLGAYYALAEMLVLPTYTDPWGLVVNEAMACGLPVIVSRAAGCASDLVRENWNGLLVKPADLGSLAGAMRCLAIQPDVREMMAINSTRLVSQFSPLLWSEGIVRAIRSKGAIA